jgi:integrase/recombinase XerD
MNTLRQTLNDYLSLRQAMGFKLNEAQRLLPRFIDFLEHYEAEYIRIDLAVKWATESHTVQPAEWAKRLCLVRVFSRFCRSIEPRTEIPPTGLLPFHPRRASPYIYSDIEIKKLLQAAGQLSSPTGLRAHTYVTVFGLLAVTGMRISELVSLENKDVNIAQAELTIRGTKFGKSRWIPLHPTTQQILHRYVLKRDHQYPIPYSSRFFVSETGDGLVSCTVRATFIKLSRKIGLRGITDSHGPRLHDFRHRFAIQTLLRWYQDGTDVNQHLPELSTYLGHVKVSDTYWYLTATPELLQLALQRAEQSLQEAQS